MASEGPSLNRRYNGSAAVHSVARPIYRSNVLIMCDLLIPIIAGFVAGQIALVIWGDKISAFLDRLGL